MLRPRDVSADEVAACDPRRVNDALTYAIELAVGTVTLAAGIAAWRSRAPRWLAVVLAVAGLAACVHAMAELVA